MAVLVTTYSQTNPLWGHLEIVPGVPLSRYGCVIASLAGLLRNYAIDENPAQVLARLQQVSGAFLGDGSLVWSAVRRAYPQVHFINRYATTLSTRNQAYRQEVAAAQIHIEKLALSGNPPILSVDAVGRDKIEDHAVVYLGDGNIMDPAYGEIAPFSKRYGPMETGLYGYVAFSGPPIAANGDIDKGIAAWKIKEYQSDPKKGFYLGEAILSLIL